VNANDSENDEDDDGYDNGGNQSGKLYLLSEIAIVRVVIIIVWTISCGRSIAIVE
jgi:hypothetical protein